MKKFLTVSTILVVLLMLSILPVFAEEGSPAAKENKTDTTGKHVDVADITNPNTMHTENDTPSVSIKVVPGDDKDVVTVTYYAAQLKILDKATDGVERPSESAWLGVRLTPKDGSENKYTHFKFKGAISKIEDNDSKSVDYYVPVTAENLEEAVKSGKDLVYTRTFSWLTSETDDENAPVTELNVIIKAKDMEVYDKENENVEWNEETYNTAVKEYEAAQKDKTPKTGI